MKGELQVRGKRDPKPLFLKLGLALALSLAAYFASNLHFRSPGAGCKKNGAKSTANRVGRPRSSEEEVAKTTDDTATKVIDEVRVLCSEEELAKIVKGASSEEGKEELELEQEIAYLRNLVEAFKERERTFEVQLLEYYGLEEQVANLREFENRVKINTTESKLLHLKIDSLQADNRRLQAQASGYPRVMTELESAREEMKALKRGLKLDGKEAREKLGSVHRRITNLQDRVVGDGEADAGVEKMLKRVKELQDELMDLRMVNSRLTEENFKLVQLLKSTKDEASSNLKDQEVEVRHLREENEKLKKEIEQLQTARCTDVEELVYLRWVNACLRYELRNYQPPPGKTVAKDLGRSLSPKSEERAKQLILEYAHNSGVDDKDMILFDFEMESCFSRASSEECTDTSIDISCSTKNSSSGKSKLLSKLRRLILGKDCNNSRDMVRGTTASCGSSTRRASFEDLNGVRRSFDSISSCVSVENDATNHLTGTDSHASEQIHDREDPDVAEKDKLKKFADVLKGSKGSQKLKRRLVSFSSN